MIEFRAKGLEEVYDTLDEWAQQLESGDKVKDVSTIVARSTMENYERKYDSRPWPKRKHDGTDKANAWPILLKTGTKRRTELKSITRPWQKTAEGFLKQILSTDYGIYHQEGRGQKVRKSVWLQPQVEAEIEQKLIEILGPNIRWQAM
jgi:hypothetical protein